MSSIVHIKYREEDYLVSGVILTLFLYLIDYCEDLTENLFSINVRLEDKENSKENGFRYYNQLVDSIILNLLVGEQKKMVSSKSSVILMFQV